MKKKMLLKISSLVPPKIFATLPASWFLSAVTPTNQELWQWNLIPSLLTQQIIFLDALASLRPRIATENLRIQQWILRLSPDNFGRVELMSVNAVW